MLSLSFSLPSLAVARAGEVLVTIHRHFTLRDTRVLRDFMRVIDHD